jgi:DNA-binding transcriptional LysR family regulator
MNITSRQLRAFVLTARHENFSRAADQMFITQSGMSILVRELEAQLGFRLFDRTTRKVKLTESGSKFLPIADRCLSDLEAGAVAIRRSASAAVGRLIAGASPFVTALDEVAEYLAIAI